MRYCPIIAAPLLLIGVPALAQDATGTVAIDGSVAGRCLFTTPNATISLGELALAGSDDNAGRLDAGKVNTKNATLVGWCNSAAAGISVEAFPLLNAASGGANFTNRVDYTASGAASSATATDTTLTTGAGTTQSVGLFSGNVVVTLSAASAPSNALLVAGDYTGSVKVTLTPSFTPPSTSL